MNHQAFTSSNGATMAHQQNQYTAVPPSQQQQQPGVQPNHNQQPPAAGQRHHPNYTTYAAQTAQPRPQPGGGPHPNQQGQRMMQPYAQQGSTPQGQTPGYITQHPQNQQGYGLQHVAQLQARPAGPPATAYYSVPPGTQPIMTIHSANFMFPQNGPRQQIPAQQYFHHNPQMALQGHNQATMAAVAAAAAGQPQQQPVLYNYPPTLYGQVPAFHQQHITGPPPMMTTPGQQPQIPGMHQAQPPPQSTQPGQAVQVSTGGGQPALSQQHLQQNQASHPTGAPPQNQQPAQAHQPPGTSRPQPTPTPPILIQQGPSQSHQVGHPGASSSSHAGIINHPMGPPPQGLQGHDQPSQQVVPTNIQYPRVPHSKPYNETKRQRKGIAIIDPETRKEVVVNKSGSSSTNTETDAQKDIPSSVHTPTTESSTPLIRESNSEASLTDDTKRKTIQEFQSKVILAKSEGSENDASLKKKSQESSISAEKVDIVDKEKPSTNSVGPGSEKETEIHSETPRRIAVSNSKDSAKDDLSLDTATKHTKMSGENESVSMTNGNKSIAGNKPTPNALSDSSKKNVNELETVRSLNDDKPNSSKNSNKLKPQLNKTIQSEQKTISSESKDKKPSMANDQLPSTPIRRKDQAPDLEPVSPTPIQEYSGIEGSNTASFAAAAKSNVSKAENISTGEKLSQNTLLESNRLLDSSLVTSEKTLKKENSEGYSSKLDKNVQLGNEIDGLVKINSENVLTPCLPTNQTVDELASGYIDKESEKLCLTESQANIEDCKPSKEETKENCVSKDSVDIEPDQPLADLSDQPTPKSIKTEPLSTTLLNATEVSALTSNCQNQKLGIIEADLSVTTASVESDVPVENGIPEKGPTLKYEYKPDQWSPINIEGKKQYDREFLMKLQQDPLSMTKPDNLPNMDIIKDKAIAKISSGIAGTNKMPGDMFTPSFVKPTISNRGPPANRTSRGKKEQRQGPQPSGGQPQRVLILPEVNKPVVLHEAENAWKPRKLDNEDVEEDEMAILERKSRAILNKLTPQKFDKLVQQFKELQIDTVEKLTMCMELVFEKALDEPDFSVAYAKMCEVLKDKAPSTNPEEDPKKVLNFKRMLIATCQREFYRDYMEGLDKEKYDSDIAAAESEEKRKLIETEWGVRERRARKRSLGNIRFIGELYKLKMLTVRIMHECVNKLLVPNHAESLEAREESLECLCKLLTTVGKDLDEETMKKINQDGIKKLDVYFAEMANVIEGKQTSARIRFRLQDLIDLRRRHWVPRRESDGPKKIDEIHANIAREKTQQQLLDHNVGNIGMGGLNSREGSKTMGRDRDGRGNVGDARKRSSRGPQGPGGIPTDQEGWNTVPSRPPTKVQEKFDPSKLTGLTAVLHKKDPEMVMRPMGQFANAWGKGSGSSRVSQSKEDPRSSPMPRNQNRFSSLSSSLYNQTGERSVSPSGQPLGGNFDRQGSSGSQSPTNTLERQNRAPTSGASRSMGPPMFRDFRGPSQGQNDSSNERERMIHSVHTHLHGNNIGPYGSNNSAKIPSNGPPGVASISRKSSNNVYARLPVGPSDDEIKRNQQKMEGQVFRKPGHTEERINNCIINVLNEYLNSCDDSEVELTVRETFNSDVMPKCVELWVNHIMELTPKNIKNPRQVFANLLITLVNKHLLQRAQCLSGLGAFLQIAMELTCDIPKIWDYLGEIVGPLLQSAVFPMEFLELTAMQISSGKPSQEVGLYVKAVLRTLSTGLSPEQAGEMWKEAQLAWDKFLPSSDINSFVRDHKLQFTLYSGKSEDIGEELKRHLQNRNLNDNKGIMAAIDNYLKEKTGSLEGEPDNHFIRTLTTAVAESTLKGIADQPNTCSLDQDAMQQRAVILKRILDAKIERETQALYALQALIHKLEHPNKLLHQIFECLYQSDVISYEGFEQWEKSKDPAEQEGKGVAIKSTTQFFTWLREVDPDEDP